MKLFVFASLTLIAATVAEGQVAAVKPAPDGTRLRLGTDSLAVYYVEGTDTVRTGMIKDALDTVRVGDRLLLQRTYLTVDRLLGRRIDTLVSERATLSPVRVRSLTTNLLTHLDYAPDAVTGWLGLANGDSVPLAVALAAGTFDAATFDLVLRASNFREGWRIEVPSFLSSTRTVATLTARLAGVDTVAGEQCWRVEAEFAGTPVIFWIHQETRRLCQQVMQVRPTTQILFAPFRTATPADRRT